MTYAEGDATEQMRNEYLHRAKIVGLLLVFVLLVIAIYAVIAHHGMGEKLIAAALCALLAIGIVTEILLTRAVKNAGDARLAAANARLSDASTSLTAALARAATAEQTVHKLKTPRRSLLTPEATASLSAAMATAAGTQFDIGVGPNDGEVEDFIWDLEPALWAAGWTQLDWTNADGTPGDIIRGTPGYSRPLLTRVTAANVTIQLPTDAPDSLTTAANSLITELTALDIDAHLAPLDVLSANTTALHILIGPKR